jgi:dienelactone hydrolase
MPTAGRRATTAVLLLPTFGFHEACFYRSRRQWAISLAEAGFPALRIDLPGSEDSAGGATDDRLGEVWIDAVRAAAARLREVVAAERVAAIGAGLGGLVGARAACDGADLDDLILWGIPSRGRAYVRELRAYSALISPETRADRGGQVEGLGGYAMSAATIDWLEQLRLADLELPRDEDRRVLLIGRDSRGIDAELSSWADRAGAAVTTLPASDYESAMTTPQLAAVPTATIAESIRWLREGVQLPTTDAPSAAPLDAGARGATEVEFAVGGRMVRETIVACDRRHGRPLAGVLSRPSDESRRSPCVILLNGGAIRRTGPNRMWTEIARRAASRGFSALRLDVWGVGDSAGDSARYVTDAGLYGSDFIELVVRVIDELQTAGVADRFVFVGLCSSANWGLHAALEDPRIVGGVMLNFSYFEWNPRLEAERGRRRLVRAIRGGVIERHRRKRLAWRDLRKLTDAVAAIGRRSAVTANLNRFSESLATLRERGTMLVLLFSRNEPQYAELARAGMLADLASRPEVLAAELPTNDHVLRPLAVQRIVHDHIDRLLDEVYAAYGGGSAGGPGDGAAT